MTWWRWSVVTVPGLAMQGPIMKEKAAFMSENVMLIVFLTKMLVSVTLVMSGQQYSTCATRGLDALRRPRVRRRLP